MIGFVPLIQSYQCFEILTIATYNFYFVQTFFYIFGFPSRWNRMYECIFIWCVRVRSSCCMKQKNTSIVVILLLLHSFASLLRVQISIAVTIMVLNSFQQRITMDYRQKEKALTSTDIMPYVIEGQNTVPILFHLNFYSLFWNWYIYYNTNAACVKDGQNSICNTLAIVQEEYYYWAPFGY